MLSKPEEESEGVIVIITLLLYFFLLGKGFIDVNHLLEEIIFFNEWSDITSPFILDNNIICLIAIFDV